MDPWTKRKRYEKTMSEPSSSIEHESQEGNGPAKRDPLYFIWICDVSNSMRSGNKIQKMNEVIENTIIAMQKISEHTPYLQVFMRTITFSNQADWVESEFTPIESYQWKPLEATNGHKKMGPALSQVADALNNIRYGGRFFSPHLVLVTDGCPDDGLDARLRYRVPENRMVLTFDDAASNEEALTVFRRFVNDAEVTYKKIITVDSPYMIFHEGEFHFAGTKKQGVSTFGILQSILEETDMTIYGSGELRSGITLTKKERNIIIDYLDKIFSLCNHGWSKGITDRRLVITLNDVTLFELIYNSKGGFCEFGIFGKKTGRGFFRCRALNKYLITLEKNLSLRPVENYEEISDSPDPNVSYDDFIF